MKLFVNGCSFSHGHKGWTDMLPPKWVWPSLISKQFEETVNLAWQGGSNERIFRTTLDFFDDVKYTKDWLAVIQWTNPYARSELYDAETDTYYGYLNGSDKPVLDLTAHTKFIEIPKRFYRNIELYKATNLLKSEKQLESKFIQQTYILSEFFKRKEIKFLFVSVSTHSVIHPENTHPLAKLLPHENILQTPMTYFINPNSKEYIESDTDFHPNIKGHAVLSNYITNELKLRNYL